MIDKRWINFMFVIMYILNYQWPTSIPIAVGKSDPIYERNMQLEDLLEMQNQSDPVIDMEGFVLLSVRRTLLLMNRLFIKGDTPHRGSIQRRLSLSISSTSNVKI
jgi:hypothetical protein